MNDGRYAIVPVDETNVAAAGAIHAASWQESHRSFCTPTFIEAHNAACQTAYLRGELAGGTRVYMLLDKGEAVGVVSIHENLIENLYILPDKQRRGYGTCLLDFAMAQCPGVPELWILTNNTVARDMYLHRGFTLTGKSNQLAETVIEVEMKRQA